MRRRTEFWPALAIGVMFGLPAVSWYLLPPMLPNRSPDGTAMGLAGRGPALLFPPVLAGGMYAVLAHFGRIAASAIVLVAYPYLEWRKDTSVAGRTGRRGASFEP